MATAHKIFVGFACLALAGACNKKSNNDNNQGGGPTGPMGGGGPGVAVGQVAVTPTLDLSGAQGLLVVDPTKSAGASLLAAHNDTVAALGLDDSMLLDGEYGRGVNFGLDAPTTKTGGENSLQKTDSSGNIKPVITNTGLATAGAASTGTSTSTGNSSTGGNPPPQQPQPLPKIMTIAVSPKKEIFLHFERPFRVKPQTSAASGGTDNGGMDGTMCQLFKVIGGTLAELQAKPPTGPNLQCLDFNHIINNWSSKRLSVFQFDAAGNVYYPGQLPNAPTMVVYKWDRATGALTEMINSNICVQDFLVTPSGGLFYTGTSSCSGGGGGIGGFFRYVSGSSSAITEIARDWSNFVYEPVSTTTSDKAIFFGPDPTSASTASWSSACLFNFDPAGGSTTAQRTAPVITCGANLWDWINMSRTSDITTFGTGFQNNGDASTAWKTEYANRCTSSGQIFAGGGSQISSIKQDSTGNVYVIGNVRKKNAGTLACNVDVRGPHCKLNGMPDLTITSSDSCVAKTGTWVDDGTCSTTAANSTSAACFTASGSWNRKTTFYSGVTTAICTQAGGISGANWWSQDNSLSFQNVSTANANTVAIRVNNFQCSAPASNNGGDPWTSEYQGLGLVNASTKTLSLLSSTSEQAIRLWVINDKAYYSAYDTTKGQYLLRTWSAAAGATTMVSNFEVYNLSDTGDGSGTALYYDALDFSNNTYNFGTVTVASPYARTTKTGLTGTLKTVVILPKN